MDRKTREEFESLSLQFFGKANAYKKMLNGILSPDRDAEGKQLTHKGIPLASYKRVDSELLLNQLRSMKKSQEDKARAEAVNESAGGSVGA